MSWANLTDPNQVFGKNLYVNELTAQSTASTVVATNNISTVTSTVSGVSNVTGTLTIGGANNANKFTISNATPTVVLSVATDASLSGGVNGVKITGSIIPTANGLYNLGAAATGWNNIYSVNDVTVTSDRRAKTNIRNLTDGLEFVNKLQPVLYNLNNQLDLTAGFIAQDVIKVNATTTSVIVPKTEEEMYGMRPAQLIPVLVNAINELTEIVRKIEKEIIY